jgi:hypothetical protein
MKTDVETTRYRQSLQTVNAALKWEELVKMRNFNAV